MVAPGQKSSILEGRIMRRENFFFVLGQDFKVFFHI